MIANYHTHTWRCNHAVGTEEEYVAHATQRGLKILGFSDHTPYLFSGNYVSRIRMRPEQLKDYITTLSNLRNLHKDSITIHIGLEAEYYPENWDNTLPFLRDAGIEYLIFGQHSIPGEPGIYPGAPTEDESILKTYCLQSMKAIDTGVFTYFAHPDLIHYIGDKKIYQKYMRELIRHTKSCGLPAEINLLGMLEERHYPGNDFLEVLAEESCPVILGCDAHDPVHLSDTAMEEKALSLIEKYHLTLIDTVPLRRI